MQAAGPRRLRRYRIFFSSKIDLTLITPLQQPSYSFMPDFRGLSSTSEHVSMRPPLTLALSPSNWAREVLGEILRFAQDDSSSGWRRGRRGGSEWDPGGAEGATAESSGARRRNAQLRWAMRGQDPLFEILRFAQDDKMEFRPSRSRRGTALEWRARRSAVRQYRGSRAPAPAPRRHRRWKPHRRPARCGSGSGDLRTTPGRDAAASAGAGRRTSG